MSENWQFLWIALGIVLLFWVMSHENDPVAPTCVYVANGIACGSRVTH